MSSMRSMPGVDARRTSSPMGDLGAGPQMVIVFFVLLALRVPVAFALGLSALYAMWVLEFGLDLVGDLISAGIAKFSLLDLPFFVLAGGLMGAVGSADARRRGVS